MNSHEPPSKPKSPPKHKLRRWRRSAVSVDESLVSGSRSHNVHRATQPMMKALEIPVCAPTLVAPPIGGEPLISRLDPQDVIHSGIESPILISTLLGFAQMRPTGVKKVALVRYPAQDVIVRLYQDAGNGVTHPSWLLVRSKRENLSTPGWDHSASYDSSLTNKAFTAGASSPDEEESYEAYDDAESAEGDSLGVMFCRDVERATVSHLYAAEKKATAVQISNCVRLLTGRQTIAISLDQSDKAWEQMLAAVYQKRPVFAATKEGYAKVNKRRYPPAVPLVFLDAFEMSGERYVYVYQAKSPSENDPDNTPIDLLWSDLFGELHNLLMVG